MRQNKQKEALIDIEFLRSILRYDPETGIFTWLSTRNNKTKKGSVCATKDKGGYITISINRKIYLAHRVAWFYVHGNWPECEIDHINRVKIDNRISNLRELTHNKNMLNYPIPKTNTSGCKGVRWHSRQGKWNAIINLDGRNIHLGCFNHFISAKIMIDIAVINNNLEIRNYHE